MARRRQVIGGHNYWPGFVDALAALLVVIIFMLVVFVIAQVFLTDAITGRDKELEKLNGQVLELSELLSLEKQNNDNLKLKVIQLDTAIDTLEKEKNKISDDYAALNLKLLENQKSLKNSSNVIDQLRTKLISAEKIKINLEENIDKLSEQVVSSQQEIKVLNINSDRIKNNLKQTETIITQLKEQGRNLELNLNDEKRQRFIMQDKLSQKNTKILNLKNRNLIVEKNLRESKKESSVSSNTISNLNIQILALRSQLEAIQTTLDQAERKDKEQQVIISELGAKLNKALAQKVQELSKYRSEFFGKLREVLGNRNDILIVGDRFVLQSEVLFSSGSAELEDIGKKKLIEVAKTLLEITPSIPADINWILRVDGHTDARPISNFNFPSNWELSTARASNVVKFLIKAGISPKNIAATGFASFQPLDKGNDEISYRRNRRIEFKLTEK